MKLNHWTLNIAAALALTGVALLAQDTVRYNSQPRGAKVSIKGTSTIHDWEVEGQVIGGYFEIESAFETDKSLKSVKSLNTPGSAPKVSLFIPVTALKSQVAMGRDKMDSVMQQAMNADTIPQIRYKLTEMTIQGAVPDSGTPVKFATKGDLAISGVTNKVDLEVTLTRAEDGKLKFSGSKKLKMTDFKIQPPAPKLLGMPTISCGDDVTIDFEWVLIRKVAPAAPAAPPAPTAK
jgi:hypothetical protein